MSGTDGNIDRRAAASSKLQGKEGYIADVIKTDGHYGMVAIAPGHISTKNSTRELLGIDEVFPGEWEDITNFGVVVVSLTSNVGSAVDGLEVEFSSDATAEGVISHDHFTIFAGAQKTFSFQAAAQYFRIMYTNGGIGQSSFNMQTILKPYYVKPSSHRVNDNISGQDDAEVNTIIIKSQTNDGQEYENISVHNPLPGDSDSVYPKDVDLAESDVVNWEPVNGGTILDLFADVTKGLTYTGTDNPKNLTINFKRSIITTGGITIVTSEGSFSNVKLIAVQADGTESILCDFSSDNTDRTLLSLYFIPTNFSALRFEFHTADDVTVTSVLIPKAITTISRLQGLSSLTGLVENVGTYRGVLNVNSAWVHRKIVNEPFHFSTATSTTLNTSASKGGTSLSVADTSGFFVGDEIKLTEGALEEIGVMILTNVIPGTPGVLQLDRPLGNDYTTAAIVVKVNTEMAVVGSLISPVSFEVNAPEGQVWQITRILFSIVDNVTADDGKFGGMSALLNGVAVRATTAAGRTVTFANWKTNGDMKLDMYDVVYSDKAPAGQYGVNGRWSFHKSELVAELDGSAIPTHKMEILIQDDLTDLISFKMKAQGRVFSP